MGLPPAAVPAEDNSVPCRLSPLANEPPGPRSGPCPAPGARPARGAQRGGGRGSRRPGPTHVPAPARSSGDPRQWAALLGTALLGGADGRLSRVARVHRHPFYNAYTLDYDVALLELAAPVRASRLVRPICLPAPRAPDGARCVITGWGSLREGGRRRPRPQGRGEAPTPLQRRAHPPAGLPQAPWRGSCRRRLCAC